MPGKFINTVYTDTMDQIINLQDDLIKNPFYSLNDKKGIRVKYYNQNTEKSTLDPGSGLAYTDIGENSPIRFNIIEGLYIYQFGKVELNMDNGDFGLESDTISGESYILPNTIIPYDGDFFEIYHIKDSSWLFQVNNVQRDTLENGANAYKFSWTLDRTTNRDILKNVNEDDIYEYIDVREGTNIKSVVKKKNYSRALQLENIGTTLREYFIELFYSELVQTFVYPYYNNSNLYDPYSIEFIIRNELLEDDLDSYIYVEHKIPVPNTFFINYDKTFFRAFEERNITELMNSVYQSQADFINSPVSIFGSRYEDYFSLGYQVFLQENNSLNARGIISILSEDLIEHISNNEKYTGDWDLYKNIFVKYFNDEHIYESDIESIRFIDYEHTKDIYYHLILLIFCIDFYTKKLLS